MANEAGALLSSYASFKWEKALDITNNSPSTSIKISPTYLCPYSSTSLYPDLNKCINYAIGLFLLLSTLQTLQNATYNTITKSVNQTSTFYNFIPMFVNIEVKRRHMGKDPAIQLGA